jgi:hypothetical protein
MLKELVLQNSQMVVASSSTVMPTNGSFEILEEKIAFLAVPILDIHLSFHADEDTD